MVGTQPFEQLSLAQAGRVRGAEQLQQFALGQQAEQLFQRQLTLGIDPALLDQWRCRPTWTADLPVVQFAGAEQRALAHHHAHQQCLRRLRQQSETPDEGAFGVVQQVAMMLVHPGQNLLKVVEIVEGVFQGLTHRTSGKTGARAARSKAGYLYSSSGIWQWPVISGRGGVGAAPDAMEGSDGARKRPRCSPPR